MKRITFLAIIVAVIAASCSNKDGMFTKRKYTKGHYVAHSGKVAKPKVNDSKTAIVAEANKTQNVAVRQAVLPVAGNELASATSVNNKTSLAVKPVQTKNTNATTAAAQTKQPNVVQKLVNQRAVNKISSSKSSTATDDQLIIWVILSLFPILALIAIYLHDGKAITLNFWVDLILHITVIGYMIFALLVVLDIFTLA
jgi:hypothetical protein